MNVKKFANKKLVACAALIAAATTTAMAQGNGLAGINEATSMVTSYSCFPRFPASKIKLY